MFACLIFNEQETRRILAFCFFILSSIDSVQFSYTWYVSCFLPLAFLTFKLCTRHWQEITPSRALSWPLLSETEHDEACLILVILKDFEF